MGRSAAAASQTPIGERLQKTRTAAQISASQLSKAAGASRSVVGQIEMGLIVEPSAILIEKFATLLGTTGSWIITGKGKPPTVAATKAAWAKRLAGKAA